MINRKPVKPWRSKKYREFVADNPCLLCHRSGHTVPHHCRDIIKSGWGTKPGDQWCIPLCSITREGREAPCHDIEQEQHIIPVSEKLEFIANSLNGWMK